MDSTYFLRQLDIADPSQFKDKPITVIGAGGIGAATVIALAKTGFENITVYDLDGIEAHNFPCSSWARSSARLALWRR